MRPTTVSLTATGSSNWIPVNWREDDFNLGFQVVTTATTFGGKVEATLDNIFDPDVTPTAFAATGFSALSANAIGNYLVPCQAVRLTATAHSAGTTTLTIVQAG